MGCRGWGALLMTVLVGCGAPTRGVRLETGTGEAVLHPLPSRSASVEVSADALAEALTALVLELPLSVKPGQVGRVLRASAPADWERVDRTLQYALRRDYGRWCEQREAAGDCLSLLEDDLGFDDFDRLRVAVDRPPRSPRLRKQARVSGGCRG